MKKCLPVQESPICSEDHPNFTPIGCAIRLNVCLINSMAEIKPCIENGRKNIIFIKFEKTLAYYSMIKETWTWNWSVFFILFRTCTSRIADLSWITFNYLGKSLLQLIKIKNVFLSYIFWNWWFLRLTDTGENVQKWTRIFSTRRWVILVARMRRKKKENTRVHFWTFSPVSVKLELLIIILIASYAW